MYVITGATGNTGSVVAEKLLANGEKVRVVGRNAKRLERFTKKGAEAFVADATDAGALTKAFSERKGCVRDDSTLPGASRRRHGRGHREERAKKRRRPE